MLYVYGNHGYYGYYSLYCLARLSLCMSDV